MIQLIIRSPIIGYTLAQDFNNVTILLESSHFPTVETNTTTAISALVITIPTSIPTLDNAQDVKMGTPIPETHIVIAKAVKNLSRPLEIRARLTRFPAREKNQFERDNFEIRKVFY
jgi:hypothetical protein